MDDDLRLDHSRAARIVDCLDLNIGEDAVEYRDFIDEAREGMYSIRTHTDS